ncbi:uncharacterized protein TRAVEDRAFT_25592 [Trametes versicolor FP-101664 SS1]|uniref:uncharacterized protein n=1 Tax=Trametes versicolor (strain FP-101664) TaxID=717944 RepID=UPI0004623B36|nr:uncharacterized protein TRAVEDRAFT_25592 [Trametes versicolor FP-101664 SS1]EIW64417.1 hypothetical protein TRAVEDRAFT_25592 [Trametes versicolor FP-101664 SS1]
MGSLLPDELWLDIFDQAVEDADLFDHTLPTAFSEASWFKTLYGEWSLRTAQEGVNNAQRRSYATKKAIMSTCRTWRRLGYEFFYRFLFFSNPRNIQRVCAHMDRDKNLGWWTRRLHVTRYFAGGGTTMETTQNSLVSIIRHCPNLQTFIVNWPLSNTLQAIGDAICTFCPRTLRVLHINIPTTSLAKLIHMLQCLPKLATAHIEFDGTPPEQINLGAAADLALTLPALQHLSLRGPFQDFLEEAIGWEIPLLQTLCLDFVNHRDDFPDLLEFLRMHGAQLTFLDLNIIPTLDVPTILDLCPMLITFTFNPDWRIPAWEQNSFVGPSAVRRPHANITTIGLHHLLYAFGVGYAATYDKVDPFATQMIRRRNDVNFAALNRRNFPRLERVRVLNTTLLSDLEANNGPSQHCYERWERWSRQCQKEGIRLEDCTGEPLGTLPMDSETEDDTDDETEESVQGEAQQAQTQPHLSSLRELLMECRRMNAQREADVTPPALRMIYAGTSRAS